MAITNSHFWAWRTTILGHFYMSLSLLLSGIIDDSLGDLGRPPLKWGMLPYEHSHSCEVPAHWAINHALQSDDHNPTDPMPHAPLTPAATPWTAVHGVAALTCGHSALTCSHLPQPVSINQVPVHPLLLTLLWLVKVWISLFTNSFCFWT